VKESNYGRWDFFGPCDQRGQRVSYLALTTFVLHICPVQNQLLAFSDCWLRSKRRKKSRLAFSLFPAEHGTPSSAWRPVALTLLTLCVMLLIGLTALGLVCKSGLCLGDNSVSKVSLGGENIVMDFSTLILECGANSVFLLPKATVEMTSHRSIKIKSSLAN
jgi:hypothetical protein